MDESISPFMGGDITIAHPGLTVLNLIGSGAKVRLNLSSGGKSLTATLNVQARQLVVETGEVGINLVNDEAFVEDWSPATAINYGPQQTSLLSIVNAVLTKSLAKTTTATVVSGTDVPVKTFTEVKNLIPNGSFETALPNGLWTLSGVTATLDTVRQKFGSYSLRLTPNTTSVSSYVTLPVPLTPGQTYTYSGYWYLAGTPQSGTLSVDARKLQFGCTVNGTQYLQRSAQVPNTANLQQRVSMTFRVPWNAENCFVRIICGATNSADNRINIDGLFLVEGDGLDTNGQPMEYFDGDTPNTADYSYVWDDTTQLSSSTRTPVLEREPDALIWQPGTGGMRFLKDLTEAVGLRLFQDIDGAWKLANNEYRVAGQARLAYGFNLLQATDLMSRTATQTDGLPLFADAVVLNYAWTDVLGRERTAQDIAAPAVYTKPYVPDTIERPYPGPGRAAYMLSRLALRQRQFQVTGLTDYAVRPGQEAVITTVDGGVQSGYVDAVTWDFGNDEMEVVTKGVIGLPVGSIGYGPDNETINQTGTIGDW
ncbi:hypothetical protein Q7F20_09215 [Curtobacterium sp. A7_M15]|uniref:hypothetical protein n=1 Tax=Curtobacterium sp. A7_M15 TaxID=3065241 RepID=UPI002737B5DF|nr:hypothetical protein [Curtobacterium sp. A7_M15]MDP4333550.1 hypothetical protein [Curtobacterium sp. A7_M15]